jgi:hypothetical protein
MSEPRRLLDETNDELMRAVLLAGRSHNSSPQRRAQVLAALGVGAAMITSSVASAGIASAGGASATAAGAGGGVFAASSKASLLFAALSKNLLLSSLVASSAAGFAAYQVASPEAEVRVPAQGNLLTEGRAVTSRVASVPGIALAAPEAVQPLAAESSNAAEFEKEPVNARGVHPFGVRSATREAGVSALNEELALLDRARAGADQGRPQEALRLLDQHAQTFPKGRLGLEAEVLRVQALAEAGRKEEASVRAQRILKRSPNSVVAARLRRYVTE